MSTPAALDQELLVQKMDENARRANPLSGDDVEREALVESAIASAAAAVDIGLAGRLDDHLVQGIALGPDGLCIPDAFRG